VQPTLCLALGIPFDGVEHPVVPAIFLHDTLLEAGPLAAWRRCLATLRVTVTPATVMEAFDAGMNGTILDGSDQLSRQSVAKASAWQFNWGSPS
jgi:hypothetical protein